MIYPIYVYGSSVLRKTSTNITADYPKLKEFIADMYETMYDSDGVGLAAPQVGKNIRLFVIDGGPFADMDPQMDTFKKTFINAEIYERYGDSVPFTEGCLSVPGINEEVMRMNKIKIRYVDENFVEHDDEFDGMAARVVQHEYDHIDGKLFIDHLVPLRKVLLKSKLAAMVKGDYRASYKCKQVR